MNIGERIKEIRGAKQITQSYINYKMGKSVGWLANIEKGRREIRARELIEVIGIMNVSLQEFFGLSEAYAFREHEDTNILRKGVKKA